jgi:hypothetical protein
MSESKNIEEAVTGSDLELEEDLNEDELDQVDAGDGGQSTYPPYL